MSVERRTKVEASLNRKKRKAEKLSAQWLAGTVHRLHTEDMRLT
jgi:hypothetical protein